MWNTPQEVGMSIARNKYKMGDADFYNIRNRNEGRVVRVMSEFLQQQGNPQLSRKALQDVYALALNGLPPRYTQQGTIVWLDPVKKAAIYTAVENAYHKVMAHPRP